ncbi:MAG: hypothetical protein KKD28_03530, partial [Chloroflexi bacterium]|nr:hypothetical protein [Chloroflexota bacterium]
LICRNPLGFDTCATRSAGAQYLHRSAPAQKACAYTTQPALTLGYKKASYLIPFLNKKNK